VSSNARGLWPVGKEPKKGGMRNQGRVAGKDRENLIFSKMGPRAQVLDYCAGGRLAQHCSVCYCAVTMGFF
jgi:hypothetical protein